MPTYCYLQRNGKPIDLVMSIEEKCARERSVIIRFDSDELIRSSILLDDGTIADRDFEREWSRVGFDSSKWKDFSSLALAIDANQVPKAMEINKRLGVPVEYVMGNHCARPKFTDRNQRAAFLKAHKKIDKDGGYKETY